MSYDSTPDIYLMKRQKTRAGCLTALIVVAIVAVIAGVGYALYRHHAAARPATAEAEPLALPDAPVDAPLDTPALPSWDSSSSGAASSPSEPPPPPSTPVTTATPASPAPAPATPPPEQPSSAPENASTPPPAAPAVTPAAAPSEALAAAISLRDQGDFAAARASALQALASAPGDPAIEQFLSEIAMPLLASRRPMPEKTEYAIQSGDYLGKIAAKFNTPVALIAIANEIRDPTRIRIGQRLTLLDGNNHIFAVTVSKTRNDLLLTLDGAFFKRYRVATGKGGKTPVGTFKIVDKIEHPAWHVPGRTPIPFGDPENLLGTHWLALDIDGYGLHGTWAPETIGQQASDGCVRLLNDDIQELYSILPKGTTVTITE